MLVLYPGPARARPRGGVVTLFGAVVLGLALLFSLPGSASSAGAPSTGAGSPGALTAPSDLNWEVVPSPNQDNVPCHLTGVAVVSTNDVWAVGYCGTVDWGGSTRTLVIHWDGRAWNLIPSPSPGSVFNQLDGVAAVSANDVWAVGYFSNTLFAHQTLAMHWDGTAWNLVPSPNAENRPSLLYGVTAVATNDVWAVGTSWCCLDFPQTWTLAMHWDGAAWSLVETPNSWTRNVLNGVAAVTSNDVWAVGSSSILHWDGTMWNPVSRYALQEVAAVSADDVWAVGESGILHWDGTIWSLISSNAMEGVAAISADDVWAVGESRGSTLTTHWNGTEWVVVSSPSPSTTVNRLYGVAAVSANDVWAVGDYFSDLAGAEQTLVEHWSPCPPPEPTSTPTPTLTPIPTPTVKPFDDEVLAYYNFEQGLEPWIPVTDSPYHNPFVTQVKGDNGCPDMHGWHFAQLATLPKPVIDPAPVQLDPHASWISADFPITGGGYRLVTVKWSARWSQDPTGLQQGMESSPAVYIGTTDPNDGAQFTSLEGKLTHNWQTYTYEAYVKLGTPDEGVAATTVHIGIGWDDAGDMMDLDCLSISIAKVPSAGLP